MKLIILILTFSYAFGWNQIINVPEVIKEIHLDIYLTNNITTTNTTFVMNSNNTNYDLPNNFDANYTLFPKFSVRKGYFGLKIRKLNKRTKFFINNETNLTQHPYKTMPYPRIRFSNFLLSFCSVTW